MQHGGFLSQTIERCHTNSTTTDPCYHSDKIWDHSDKMGYNSACVGIIAEILVSNRGFSGFGYWMMLDKFHHDQKEQW